MQEQPIRIGLGSPSSAEGDAREDADKVGDDIAADEEKDVGGIVKSRKPASHVWQFFSPRYNNAKDNRVCVKCKICNVELTYSNTTNMHNHLVRKHNSDYLDDLASGKKVKFIV